MVPNIITTKDLSYLEDIYSWNFNACKEINSFIDCIEDEQILKKIKETSQMHKEICKKILTILGG